jgi:hypothetical protein
MRPACGPANAGREAIADDGGDHGVLRGQLRDPWAGRGRKGSGSFLKKRTKKLFSIGCLPMATDCAPKGESFLVLFFKKELLPSYSSGSVVNNNG